MPRPQPAWRKAFDKVERTVGVPLENAANSNRFMDLMAMGMRTRRTAVSKLAGVVHGVTGGVLHAVNIPTRDDVRGLNSHLVNLAAELRTIEQSQRRENTQQRRPSAARDGDDD